MEFSHIKTMRLSFSIALGDHLGGNSQGGFDLGSFLGFKCHVLLCGLVMQLSHQFVLLTVVTVVTYLCRAHT